MSGVEAGAKGLRARIIWGDSELSLESQFENAVAKESQYGDSRLVGVRWAMAVAVVPHAVPWPFFSAILLFRSSEAHGELEEGADVSG